MNDIFEWERHHEIYSYHYMGRYVKKSRDFVDISLLAENNVRKLMLDDTLG